MQPSQTKPCKYCGEEMGYNAIKCKHCGEYQDAKYKWKGVEVKPGLFQKVFCTHCHYTGKGKTVTKGSLFLEIFLWLFIIPGVFYSGYRQKSKHCICPKCGSDRINKI